MNEGLREELQRFGRTFIARLKFVLGGTLLATVFFFFYAGIKANYVAFEILAAISLTLSTLIVCAAIVAVIAHVYTTRLKQR